jgi:hypothetical protein
MARWDRFEVPDVFSKSQRSQVTSCEWISKFTHVDIVGFLSSLLLALRQPFDECHSRAIVGASNSAKDMIMLAGQFLQEIEIIQTLKKNGVDSSSLKEISLHLLPYECCD